MRAERMEKAKAINTRRDQERPGELGRAKDTEAEIEREREREREREGGYEM